MKPFNQLELIIAYLKKRPEERLTARDIAEGMYQENPKHFQEKEKRSLVSRSEAELIQQIVSEISSAHKPIMKKEPRIKITAGRPKRYYYSELTEQQEIDETLPKKDNKSLIEQDLYPL